MKMRIITILFYSLMICGIVAGYWFGLIELQRLSIWCTWAISVFGFMALCVPSKDFFKNSPPKSRLLKILILFYLFLLVVTGFFFTATIFASFLITFRMKWGLWKEKEKKETNGRSD